MLPAETDTPAASAVPSHSRIPRAGRVTIVTLARLSPSTSAKLKSPVEKVYARPSSVVTVLSAALGASWTAVTSSVRVRLSALSRAPSLTLKVNVV